MKPWAGRVREYVIQKIEIWLNQSCGENIKAAQASMLLFSANENGLKFW
jgi:hypothetical protein